ncbi:hypothetical protein Dimus_038855 [Dionaea muscipula]
MPREEVARPLLARSLRRARCSHVDYPTLEARHLSHAFAARTPEERRPRLVSFVAVLGSRQLRHHARARCPPVPRASGARRLLIILVLAGFSCMDELGAHRLVMHGGARCSPAWCSLPCSVIAARMHHHRSSAARCGSSTPCTLPIINTITLIMLAARMHHPHHARGSSTPCCLVAAARGRGTRARWPLLAEEACSCSLATRMVFAGHHHHQVVRSSSPSPSIGARQLLAHEARSSPEEEACSRTLAARMVLADHHHPDPARCSWEEEEARSAVIYI